MVVSCEHNNEPPGSVNKRILVQLNNYKLCKEDSEVPASSLLTLLVTMLSVAYVTHFTCQKCVFMSKSLFNINKYKINSFVHELLF
jgi:hypothetical protein